ncbi:MAG: tRNA dihydrouridine synthase [Fastidiosipilaceae bacterium]|jgi:tRNA-dihydrouridine synthase B
MTLETDQAARPEPTLSPIRPLTLGDDLLTTDNNLFLAPMAGASELCYRQICRRFGAGATVTELVSARGIRYGGINRKNIRYIEIDPKENPVFIQLFGFDPDDFVAACNTILDHPLLSQCAGVDINMGCPVPKVTKTGAGAGLMKTPETAARIARVSADLLHSVGKPLTVKFRKGFANGDNSAAEFAKRMLDAGADMLTVHGRTASMMYGGQADWSCIREVVLAAKAAGLRSNSRSSPVPVIANGDIKDPDSMNAAFRQTGAQGVMIGRAAQGNPWLFRNLIEGRSTKPGVAEMSPVILEHLDGLIRARGERVALPEFRKTLIWYTKGTPGAVELRRRAVEIESRDDVVTLLTEWRGWADHANPC